jgi:hypothetical protein
MPKELTPARRGPLGESHGSTAAGTRNGDAGRSSCGFGDVK